MKIPEIYKKKREEGRPVFSLEVFPPKRKSNRDSIYDAVEILKVTEPDFISVTYGAGGSVADFSTCEIASNIKKQYKIETLAHLTCINSSLEDVKTMIQMLKDAKIENIMALRGDIVPGEDIKREFAHANELAIEIQRKARGELEIMGACYPEGHYEAESIEEDIQNLKYKIGAGVRVLISQLFFDNAKFLAFMEKLRKAGISVPVSAGIMPIVKASQIEKTVQLSGASLPHDFTELIARYQYQPKALYEAGIEYAVGQCRELIAGGVDGVHIYTMNDPKVAVRVHEGIKDLL